MAALTEEYTDTKKVRHKVEHLVVSADDKLSREQLLEELFQVLEKPKNTCRLSQCSTITPFTRK